MSQFDPEEQHRAAIIHSSQKRIQNATNLIWVTFRKEGIHRYPAALTDHNLRDVSFLGLDHRHMFHFKVGIQVFHNDRDLEFIQIKRWLESLYNERDLEPTLQLNNQSCEMMADNLFLEISKKYPNRYVEIEVSEDGENGCFKSYPVLSTTNN